MLSKSKFIGAAITTVCLGLAGISHSFAGEKHFDFSSPDQLLELPSHGDNPSYIDNGKLVSPIAKEEHKGLGRKFPFETEVDEAEVEFEIKLSENYHRGTPHNEVGKLIGMEGIYDHRAGWGGKPVRKHNSWSVRIATIRQNADGKVPIGIYVYHPDMKDKYGTAIAADYALETDKAYTLKLHIKLNDIDKNNGEISLFVDGEQVYKSTEWKLRLNDMVHIKSVWLDAYIGGLTPSPEDVFVEIDNLKVTWP